MFPSDQRHRKPTPAPDKSKTTAAIYDFAPRVTFTTPARVLLPSSVSDYLNLELGLRRAVKDASNGQAFFTHPCELGLINVDRSAWLANLRAELSTYVPSDLFICNIIKPNGAVRPGGILPLRDQTVYAALVSAVSNRIREAVHWKDEFVDYSYPISAKPNDSDWFANYFPLWRGFAVESLSRITKWADPVVFVDIAAYYESIDIGLLLSDLRSIGAPPPVLELLSTCLNKWSQASIPGRSLPQGFSASNILARFYLNRVDRALRERGINHLRYVDDIRLFCQSEEEAKRHYVELIMQLRKRGLAIQTAKSGIVRRPQAIRQIEGLLPALQTILKDFVSSIAELFEVSDPYFDLEKAEKLLEKDPNAAPIGLIHEAYRRFFLQVVEERRFDKTLFHFLLRRLGRAKDAFAFDHAVQTLKNQPQETGEVLRYIAKVARVAEADNPLLDYLESESATYPHQFYEVIAWRSRQNEYPNDRFLRLVRSVLYERSISPYLRSTCREFLARFGTEADVDRIQDSLPSTSDDLERAELLCSLRRMETSRRNSVLARYAAAGPYTGRAVQLVRSGWMPGT